MTFARSTVFGILLSISAVGCNEKETSAAVGTKVEAKAVAASSPAEPSVHANVAAAAPHFDEEAFAVKLEVPAQAKVGVPVEVNVVLSAKDGFKVNPEYPIKFSFVETDGVAFETAVLKKEQGKVEKASATLSGKATLKSAGAKSISGKLSFSVCTEDRCLIEKRDLTASVTAS